MAVQQSHSLRQKHPYSEFFWSVFSRIRTEYGEIRSIPVFSSNAIKYGPEKLRIRTLSHSDCLLIILGYYMYVETSYNVANDTANLETPNIDFPTGGDKICVRFWYHMYGQHVGEFKIFHKLTTKLPTKPLWKRTRSIINKWLYAQILIPRRPAFSVSSPFNNLRDYNFNY